MNDKQRTLAVLILGVLAVACICAGTVLAVNKVDAGPLWAALGTSLGAIAGVVIPRSADPAD